MSSPVRAALTDYVAGRSDATRVVQIVAETFYREGGRGKGEGLEPLMAVIERAAPGIVQLTRTASAPGFQVELAERRFPREYEASLREAAATVLASWPADTGDPLPPSPFPLPPSLFRRFLTAIQRLFIS